MRSFLVSGIKWGFIEQFGVQIIILFTGVFMARILSPVEFGLVAMITVFTGYSSILVDFGLGSAIIQKKNITKLYLSTAFWTNLSIGAAVSALILISSNAIAKFYDKPVLEEYVPLIALGPFLAGVSVIQLSLLRRNLKFRNLFWIRFLSIVCSSILAIILALIGFGIWSLIWLQISERFFMLMFSWINTKFSPSLCFSKVHFLSLMSFSLPLFLNSTLTYLYRNLDSLVIGKTLGANLLGSYNKAYSLMQLPVTNLSNSLGKVFFPIFSKIQDDLELIGSYYFKTISILIVVAIPLMTIASILAEPIVLLIFGPQWLLAVGPFSILAIASIIQVISSINGNIFLALGETKLLLKIGVVLKIFNAIIIIMSVKWGLIGVSYGILIASYIVAPINLYFVLKLLSASYKRFLAVIVWPFAIGLFVTPVLYYINKSLDFESFLGQIVSIGGIGIIMYLIAFELSRPSGYLFIRDLIVNKFIKRKF